MLTMGDGPSPRAPTRTLLQNGLHTTVMKPLPPPSDAVAGVGEGTLIPVEEGRLGFSVAAEVGEDCVIVRLPAVACPPPLEGGDVVVGVAVGKLVGSMGPAAATAEVVAVGTVTDGATPVGIVGWAVTIVALPAGGGVITVSSVRCGATAIGCSELVRVSINATIPPITNSPPSPAAT